MDTVPNTNAELRAIVASGERVTTVKGVRQVMSDIQRLLPQTDGLRSFNWLYLRVTEAVIADLHAPEWRDREWTSLLDIRFAQLYFRAVVQSLDGAGAEPRCWRALMEARYRPRLMKIQFALAGMNAHINHDLCIALVETCDARGIDLEDRSPQHQDYLRVNLLLESVVDEARRELMVPLIPGDPIPDLNKLRNLIAMWSTKKARDAAWANGLILSALRPTVRMERRFLKSLDDLTGLAGRGLLVPVV